MSDENKSTGKRGDFLAGKGFYIVLFACIAVIGVSAWILLFTGNPNTQPGSTEQEVSSYSDDVRRRASATEIPPPNYHAVEDAFSKQDTQEVKPPDVNQVKKPETAAETAPKNETPPPAAETKAPQETTKPAEVKPAEKQKTVDEMTFVWPVSGKVDSEFSIDMPVYNRTLAVWRVHTGIDIASALGTKVLAVTDGRVTDVFEDDMMGTTVVIDHGDKLQSVYSNLAATPVVKVGDNITMGAVIGAVGSTALGEIGQVSHLHLEFALDGEAVNPVDYLPTR